MKNEAYALASRVSAALPQKFYSLEKPSGSFLKSKTENYSWKIYEKKENFRQIKGHFGKYTILFLEGLFLQISRETI